MLEKYFDAIALFKREQWREGQPKFPDPILEKTIVKESKGKKKIKPPKTNASQPSLKGLVAAPKPASRAKPG